MCVSQDPLLGKFPEVERQNTKLELEQQAIIQRLGFVQTKMGEAAHQNAQKVASLEREKLECKAILRDLVSEQQATRVQQAKLAGAVSGVLDQFHWFDRRVENSTTQGALAVGMVHGEKIEVWQVREIFQKELSEVRRVALAPSKIDLSLILMPQAPLMYTPPTLISGLQNGLRPLDDLKMGSGGLNKAPGGQPPRGAP